MVYRVYRYIRRVFEISLLTYEMDRYACAFTSIRVIYSVVREGRENACVPLYEAKLYNTYDVPDR